MLFNQDIYGELEDMISMRIFYIGLHKNAILNIEYFYLFEKVYRPFGVYKNPIIWGY